MTKYELYYSAMQSLADRYIDLFPSDEVGDLLVPLTDLFTCRFETALAQSQPHVVYDDRWDIYSYYAYVDINTTGITILPFAINDNWYSSSDWVNSANQVYSTHDNTITVTPSQLPLYMFTDYNNNSFISSALEPLNKASVTVDFYRNSDTPYQRSGYFSIGFPSNTPSLLDTAGDLQLNPLVNRNMFVITDNTSFYNKLRSNLSNSSSYASGDIRYSAGDNGICIYVPQPVSFNTILNIVNTDTDDLLPGFPQFRHQETGEYYIGSVNGFDFDLDLPDVTLQTPDFSLLGSATSYLVDAFSELSLTIPLIFCIILTVIIKNVKG